MDKTLAWLWLADAVGSACQYAQELLALYPDPAELYDLLRAGTEAPPTCLTPRALAQLQDTTPFDFEERLDHCLLSGIELLTPDEDTYPAALRDLPEGLGMRQAQAETLALAPADAEWVLVYPNDDSEVPQP